MRSPPPPAHAIPTSPLNRQSDLQPSAPNQAASDIGRAPTTAPSPPAPGCLGPHLAPAETDARNHSSPPTRARMTASRPYTASAGSSYSAPLRHPRALDHTPPTLRPSHTPQPTNARRSRESRIAT